ncbi:MAG: hypothetical protein ACYCSF_09890 [Acidimicrobiales bacterium]
MTDNKAFPYTFPPTPTAYIPDLASPRYQQYLIGWGEKQIDAGVSGMFFDAPYLFAQDLIKKNGLNPTKTYEKYGSYLFDDVVAPLKAYAQSKGQPFFATFNSGTCSTFAQFATSYPATVEPSDYLTCSFDMADFEPSEPLPLRQGELLGHRCDSA